MDSVENVSSWDFIQAYKDRARALFQERWQAAGLGAGADAHFLVVGEELTLPFALLTQNRLDGLWNEEFSRRLRPAILHGRAYHLKFCFFRTRLSLNGAKCS